ncbi:MAG: hypothetical protein KAH23_04270 [Kiritimatiellae bacterium]|nr:hypothetical protein [Kiritimatiellia bacterium]
MHTQLRQNLSHELKYLRILRGGFKSAFEEVDTYSYRLEWKAGAASAEFYTELSEVVPSEEGENEYRNWASGVDAVYPIVSYIKLLLSSVYTMRMNEKGVADSDEEWLNDYNTWSTRMGTSFSLTKNIDFTTYVQHVDRTSDSETLEYERDTFAATFTFKHKF